MKSLLITLLVASLAGNAALAIYASRVQATAGNSVASSSSGSSASASLSKITASSANGTPAASASAAPQWRTPRTDADMRNVVASLRAAGYPPSMIRAVVNQMLQEKYRPENDADQAFWKRNRQTPEERAAREEANKEIAATREELLGADGTPAALLSATDRSRRYGNLSDDKVNALLKLDQEYNEVRSAAFANEQGGQNFRDRRTQQQALEAEKRADLVSILSPAELEAYDMRTSQAAQRVINNIRDIDVSEAEYAKLYQIQKAQEAANPQAGELNGAEGMINRLVGQTETHEQTRALLGDERFFKYLESADNSYGQIAQFAAKQPAMNQATTYALYQLQSEMMLSMASTRGTSNGAPSEQQIAQFRATAESYNTKLQSLLGAETAEAYKKQGMGRMFGVGAGGRGGAVRFGNGGGRN
ncbi:hypothetical protein [Oleiharenicola lentus]|uniref:hypothetical protein n=1 Tax=Oleiharenicola lentus TaxID=2508720 RepID=UPI003F661E06